MRLREVFLRPLPEARVNIYIALASMAFAFIALYYAGRTFELQRRDGLVFELSRRLEDYEHLAALTDCQGTVTAAQVTGDVAKLRDVVGHIRIVLAKKREAKLFELLDIRDRVVTEGTGLMVTLTRDGMAHRAQMAEGVVARVAQRCGT